MSEFDLDEYERKTIPPWEKSYSDPDEDPWKPGMREYGMRFRLAEVLDMLTDLYRLVNDPATEDEELQAAHDRLSVHVKAEFALDYHFAICVMLSSFATSRANREDAIVPDDASGLS